MMANEPSLSEAHQIMVQLWEDRAAMLTPVDNPETIAYDPDEVDDLLQSVNIPESVYKVEAPTEVVKSTTPDVDSFLKSFGL